MLMVISPAKALKFEPPAVAAPVTHHELQAEVAMLAKATRRLRAGDLKRMMGISDKLAALNRERFQAFDPGAEDGLQAVFAFNGDVYQGLQARTLDTASLEWAQEHLRILSGLYGLLRPLDAIQPYRLEMGSALKTRRGETLYDFWGAAIAKALKAEVKGHADPTLVNLASHEYFAAVDRKALKLPVVTCSFRQEVDGELRSLSFLAKRARGLMARFAIDRRIDRAEDLKAFDRDGYAFRPAASTPCEWVFARKFTPAGG